MDLGRCSGKSATPGTVTDKLKRKIKNVQSKITDKSQTSKTRTGPNISYAKIESVNWATRISTKDKKEERSKNVRNSSRDKEIDKS